MGEDQHEVVKQALLTHMRQLFEEIEEDLARSHEERYALLEDVLENASDVDELRVAFEQWYADHADDLELEYELEEIWDHACHAYEDEDPIDEMPAEVEEVQEDEEDKDK